MNRKKVRVVREYLLHFSLIAKELQLCNAQSGEKCHFTYPNGDEGYAVDINFICHSYEGTLKRQEEEVTQLKFFAKGELPDNLPGNDRELIEAIWKNGGEMICRM